MSSTCRHAIGQAIKRFMIRTAPPIEVLTVLTSVMVTLAILYLFGIIGR